MGQSLTTPAQPRDAARQDLYVDRPSSPPGFFDFTEFPDKYSATPSRTAQPRAQTYSSSEGDISKYLRPQSGGASNPQQTLSSSPEAQQTLRSTLEDKGRRTGDTSETREARRGFSGILGGRVVHRGHGVQRYPGGHGVHRGHGVDRGHGEPKKTTALEEPRKIQRRFSDFSMYPDRYDDMPAMHTDRARRGH